VEDSELCIGENKFYPQQFIIITDVNISISVAYLGFIKGGKKFLIDIQYTYIILYILLFTCCIVYKIWSPESRGVWFPYPPVDTPLNLGTPYYILL